jgi:hypothetical protein
MASPRADRLFERLLEPCTFICARTDRRCTPLPKPDALTERLGWTVSE